jgi:hypothetical protein
MPRAYDRLNSALVMLSELGAKKYINRYFYRLAKVHAYIIHALRKDMPAVFGKESKKKELIKNLDQLYGQLQREHQV